MLSRVQRDGIVRCLHGIDAHAQATTPWPGPVLFGWLRDAPVPGHPDPTARSLTLVPLMVDPAHWQDHPDGPVAALRRITDEAHDPAQQAASALSLATARPGQPRCLAYLFMYPAPAGGEASSQVRSINAVDTDGTVYVLTRPRSGQAVVTIDEPGDEQVVQLLQRLITLTYPDGPDTH
ncbi:hypothetical protein [Phytohabitans kaempferiae]|uniref:ESX secretion-associated protein EspG n=1 Tax=Phytohabitans kaempferiae TaxID=1620943 RepID=A0ABV6MBM8_9ACTN